MGAKNSTAPFSAMRSPRCRRCVEGLPDCSIAVQRPFLRWAGGKQRLLRDLLRFVPSEAEYERYVEPFLGAGSLFFALQPRRAVVGDINQELINCYREVAQHPQLLSDLLKTYKRRHSKDFFYAIRGRDLNKESSTDRAARFIYLNKAAFNGIYRVNLQGVFNVPYGPTISGLSLPSTETLANAAKTLKRASLKSKDFEKTISRTGSNDFIYLDPPYPPMSETAFFAHYDSARFGWHQQLRLAEAFRELANRGCLVMLSNADLPKVTALYRGFNVHRLDALRWLGSNGDRFSVSEVVITNYTIASSGTCDK